MSFVASAVSHAIDALESRSHPKESEDEASSATACCSNHVLCHNGDDLPAIRSRTGARRRAHPNPIVIRYLNDHGYVPPFELANTLGFLKGKGIRLETQGYSPGGPKSLAALASGSIDLAGVATPAIINAIADGAKILCIAPRAGVNKEVNSKFSCWTAAR